MNDKETEAALNISPIHVKKFKVKLKRLEGFFSRMLEDEELEPEGENIFHYQIHPLSEVHYSRLPRNRNRHF